MRLEILSIQELINHEVNKESKKKLQQKMGELIKADTLIFITFDSLLEAFFETDLYNKNIIGFRNSKVKKINKIIDKINAVLRILPPKIKQVFRKNKADIEEYVHAFKIPDYKHGFVKEIKPLNHITSFDFMRILSRVNDDSFLDKQYNKNYIKILSDCLINTGNDFYFMDHKKLEKEFDLKYKDLKNNWKKIISAEQSFAEGLVNDTLSSLKDAKKEFKKVVKDEEGIKLFNELVP